MQVWNSSSSEGKKCVVCGKKTGQRKAYEESGISISIPLCHEYENGCYFNVNVKNMATLAIRSMKAEIQRQGGERK
jgi:hypothetical protein